MAQTLIVVAVIVYTMSLSNLGHALPSAPTNGAPPSPASLRIEQNRLWNFQKNSCLELAL